MPQLTTIETVQQYLGIEGSAHDDLIERLIDAASAEIEQWCGQPIAEREVTYRFVGNNTGLELLPYFPIVSVGALTYIASIGGDPETVTTGTYGVTRGRLVTSSTLWGAYDYELVLTVGYAAESLPADVVQVCVEMVAVAVKESNARATTSAIGEGRLGRKSIGTSVAGTSSTTLFERPDWQARLAPYRVVTI